MFWVKLIETVICFNTWNAFASILHQYPVIFVKSGNYAVPAEYSISIHSILFLKMDNQMILIINMLVLLLILIKFQTWKQYSLLIFTVSHYLQVIMKKYLNNPLLPYFVTIIFFYALAFCFLLEVIELIQQFQNIIDERQQKQIVKNFQFEKIKKTKKRKVKYHEKTHYSDKNKSQLTTADSLQTVQDFEKIVKKDQQKFEQQFQCYLQLRQMTTIIYFTKETMDEELLRIKRKTKMTKTQINHIKFALLQQVYAKGNIQLQFWAHFEMINLAKDLI